MDKEALILQKRLKELEELCYQRDIPVHTDFLTLHEQTIFYSLVREFHGSRFQLTGGYEAAERKIVCFLPSYEESCEYPPVSCLKVSPVQEKFADPVTHRDYLGALMNLGIERSKIGDILVDGTTAYVFCMEDMADYMAGELTYVRHNHITAEVCQVQELDIHPKFEEVSGSVASERLDVVLSLAYQTSRSKIVPYIEGEKVFVNGRLITSNSYMLKPGDIVSARGLGKFAYVGVQTQTKKGRYYIVLNKYC